MAKFEFKAIKPGDKKLIARCKDIFGFETDFHVCEWVLMNTQNRPFIKRGGLLWKMVKLYGIGNFSIQSELMPADALPAYRQALQIPETVNVWVKEGGKRTSVDKPNPFIIVRGVVTVRMAELGAEVSQMTFDDMAAVNGSNLPHFNWPYAVEQASTRATNRAMRSATNCGETSVEEINMAATDINASEVAKKKEAPASPTLTSAGVKETMTRLSDLGVQPWEVMTKLNDMGFDISRAEDMTIEMRDAITDAVKNAQKEADTK